MAFKIEKFGAEVSNAKSILGGISYYRYAMTNNDDITTAGYFPSKLGLKEGDRIWVTPKTKTDADALYVVSNVSDAGVVTVVAAPSDAGQTIQVEELPTASADELGNIYQFIGTTDANYTNGYFYKCTGAGEPVVYSWTQVDVQPAPEALPDQTGQSGKFLTTDGTDASWGTLNALQNTATGTNSLTVLGTASTYNNSTNIGASSTAYTNCVAVGHSSEASNTNGCVAIGKSSTSGGNRSIAIGTEARADGEGTIAIGRGRVQSANTIQLDATNGVGLSILNEQYTMHVVLREGTRIKLIDSDGRIPAARHASLPAADGTYVLKLTISGGVPTLAWVAE